MQTQNYSLQGASQTFTVKYGPGMGLRLKRIYWAQFYSVPPAVNVTYDISNLNGSGIYHLEHFWIKID